MRTIRILINESREFIGGYKKSYIPYNPITMAPLHTLSITHKDTAVETHRQGDNQLFTMHVRNVTKGNVTCITNYKSQITNDSHRRVVPINN